jgi:hypothetical protein
MACTCGGSQKEFGLSCACNSACGCGRAGGIARVRITRIVRLPLAPVGELRGVIYRARSAACETPKNYVHFFNRPPLLAADREGQRLYIIGGRYRVTTRGIEG